MQATRAVNGFSRNNTFYYYRGRVALHAVLQALEVGPGDEVLVPGFTCVAVTSPILGIGARPVYVDIDPRTYNLDPEDLEKRIGPRSRAVIAQHTYGIPCDMDAIMTIARNYNLAVIEDACHVWGSTYRGAEIGTIGAAAFYSYDPGKPFIIGMGGAAVINEEPLREKIAQLYRDFTSPGVAETTLLNLQYLAYRLTRHPRLFWTVRDLYRFLSRNGMAIATWTRDEIKGDLGPDYKKRLPRSLQWRLAAMLRRGESVIAQHKRRAERYAHSLQNAGISVLQLDLCCEAVLICYPLQVLNKPALLAQARRNNVELGDWFSSPVHPLEESQWSAVGYEKGCCPTAEAVARRVVTLPCHAGVTQGEMERTLTFLTEVKAQGLLVPVEGEAQGAAWLAEDRLGRRERRAVHRRRFRNRPPDYTAITEIPGTRLTREALAMHRSRYAFAQPLCVGKDVLEVACGAGTGLGYMANKGARRVVGGDCSERLTRIAASYYRARLPVLRLDAQSLPFREATFDVLLMYEAIYYLENAGRFVEEAARVLRRAGQLVICTINPEWPGLIPSAYSTRYWAAHELVELLKANGFRCRIWGSFPNSQDGMRTRFVSLIKRIPKADNLIPQTMRGKQTLKRLFLGPLGPVPNQVCDEMAPLAESWELADLMQARHFKVIYAVGRQDC